MLAARHRAEDPQRTMYTSCPECGTVYRITAAELRLADGMVRCGECPATFNALASLSDEPPPTVSVPQLRQALGPARGVAVTGAPPPIDTPPPSAAWTSAPTRTGPVDEPGPDAAPVVTSATVADPARAEDSFIDGAPADEAPAEHMPVEDTPVEDTPDAATTGDTPAPDHDPSAPDAWRGTHAAPLDAPPPASPDAADGPWDAPAGETSPDDGLPADDGTAGGDETLEFNLPEDAWSTFFPDVPKPPAVGNKALGSPPPAAAGDETNDWASLLRELDGAEEDDNQPVYVIGAEPPEAATDTAGPLPDDLPDDIGVAHGPAVAVAPTDGGHAIDDIVFDGEGLAPDEAADVDHATGEWRIYPTLDHDAPLTVTGPDTDDVDVDVEHDDDEGYAPVFVDDPPAADDSGVAAAGNAAGAARDPAPATPDIDASLAPAPHWSEGPHAWQPPALEEEAPPRRNVFYALGSVVLALLLLGQVIHHERDQIATRADWGPTLERVYSRLGQPLYPAWNLRAYEVRGTEAVIGADNGGRLEIRAQIVIKGTEPVGAPTVKVTLRDRWSNEIDSRLFGAAEYLQASLQDTSRHDPGAVLPVRIALRDPGTEAYGYEVDVCVVGRNGPRCQQELEPFR